MVGNGNEFCIERLLQMFKILDGIPEKQLVLDAVLGQVFRIGVIIARIKEVLVAEILVDIVAVPERS